MTHAIKYKYVEITNAVSSLPYIYIVRGNAGHPVLFYNQGLPEYKMQVIEYLYQGLQKLPQNTT